VLFAKNMKSREIQLPKGYLSYSQVQLWDKDRERYKQIYFDGRDDLRTSNKAMEYGKAVATALETATDTGDLLTDEAMFLLKKYDLRDKEIVTYLKTKEGTVKIMGRPDTMDSTTHAFREYKTGKNAWTQKKAQAHLQMKFYATLIYLAHGTKLNEAWLDWIETETTPEGVVSPTGRVESFHVHFTFNDILNTMAMIARVAKEIELAWSCHVPPKPLSW